MRTAGSEFTQTLTAELFGTSSKRRAFAVLAWVMAFAGQAFAVTLVVDPTGESPNRDRPLEPAERAPATTPVATPGCRARPNPTTRVGVDALPYPAGDARWAEQADELVDYAESRLASGTELLRGRAACPFTWPLAK
jgi:hypothetical protein